MTTHRSLPLSLVGGEISRSMFGRPDDPKYAHAAALLSGFYVEATGAANNGPGSEFVRSTRNHDKRAIALPFRAARGQGVQVELGFRQEHPGSSIVPGYARFHRNGATVLHSAPWNAATVYVPGMLVTIANSLYNCRVANTNQQPPNATFWETLEWVPNRPIPAAAAAPPNAGVTTGTPGSLYFGVGAPHGLETNEPFLLMGVGASTAPGGMIYGVVYYTIVVDTLRIQFALVPGGPAQPITTVGTGTFHQMNRFYRAGELVSDSAFPGIFYCRTTNPLVGEVSIAPGAGNETFWYQQPTTGEYEIPTTLALTEDELFALTSSQDGNVLSIATGKTFVCELVPIPAGTSALVSPIPYDHWRWLQVSLTPPILPPTLVNVQATKRGKTYAITEIISFSSHVEFRTAQSDARTLVQGLDHVYIENLTGAMAATFNNKYWGVEHSSVSFDRFAPIDPETGQYVGSPTAAFVTGTARTTKLNSDDSNSYIVTAVDAENRESQPSAVATVVNNLFATGAYNEVNWLGLTVGAVRYRVYKLKAGTGLYGLIGESTTTTFKDESIPPNLGLTPPILDTSLASAPNHTALPTGTEELPAAVSHFEGSRCFAATRLAPRDVWLTRKNTESELAYSIPVKATDRIHQRVKSPRPATIRHLVPIGQLVALSDTVEFRISPINTDALTPESFAARPQTYVGAAAVQPEIVHNILLFVAAASHHIYQLGWSEGAGGYITADLCERAAHLFDGFRLVQVAAQHAPLSILWCVRSDGRLLGCTFIPNQQVFAWHQHKTDGFVESVSVSGEGDEERVYVHVRRTINSVTKRYVERLGSMLPVVLANSWLVDCGVRLVTTSAVTTVSGLDHLESKEVAVLANGLVQARRTVASGAITLATPLPAGQNNVLVGLPPLHELQTVPAAFAMDGYGIGRPKNISKVFVRVEASGSFEIGPTLDEMVVHEVPPGESFSGLVEVRVSGTWTYDGQLFIQQKNPLPLKIVSVTAEMAVGG